VRRRIAALLHALEKATAFGSAAVPGRINPMTDLTPVSIMQILRPIIHRLGAAKNGRAPARAGKGNVAGNGAVPGRVNATADLTPVSINRIGRAVLCSRAKKRSNRDSLRSCFRRDMSL